MAAKVVLTGVLLVYSSLIVPVQLSFWMKDDPCFVVPTLTLDVFVDFFFLVWNGGEEKQRERGNKFKPK